MEENKKKTPTVVITKAPYNFVPFSEKVIERYMKIEDLPAHDVIDPKLKSGEIHITIKAETPVFISDGTKEGHFFKGANGKYMLPGSSVRGMIRNNMYILGFGKVTAKEDVADQQLFYRRIADAKTGIGAGLKKYYHNFLDINIERIAPKVMQSTPQNVNAGFLRNHNDEYEIVSIGKNYFRLSREDENCQEWKDKYTYTEDVFYTLKDSKIDQVSAKKDEEHTWLEGTILCTGKPVGKPNAIYLFPKAAEDAEVIPVSKKEMILYQEDYQKRENVLGEKKTFWKLPEKGEAKPVFFTQQAGFTVFGMSLFLRIPYSKKLTDGLPLEHQKEDLILDYPKSMLGFATQENAYRSRISFGDLEAMNEAEETDKVETVLGEPRPSFYAGYTVDGKHYEDDFCLRGYKQYWLKEEKPVATGNEKVDKTMHPLPERTEFHGVIKYKNLHEDELGLLLWAIRLEEKHYQSIGMAKPYGYGRVEISLDMLKEYDFTQRYTIEGLLKSTKPSDAEQIQEYIEKYQNCAYVKNTFGGNAGIMDQSEIKDFFCIHKKICQVEDVRYMTLAEYGSATEVLPSLEEIRSKGFKRDKKSAAPPRKKNNTFEEREPNVFAALKGLF